MVIPLFKVFMAEDIADKLLPVLHSGYIGEGKKTREFELALAYFIGNDNVVAVNSGTSAIVMALRLAGVGHGDRVITTPMTCLATNMAILSLGADPVWADVLPDGTMDPKDAGRKIMGGPKPKAVICIDWGGLPCQLDEIRNVLRPFAIPLIEDACQAIGSRYRGRQIGSDADYVCFSFQAIKYLTTGDGGMLVVNAGPDKLKEARLMRWFGLDRTKSASMRCDQDPPIWGYKFQTNDIAATIGLANFRYLPEILRTARLHAEIYDRAFGDIEDVSIMPRNFARESAYWLYTILVDDPKRFIAYMLDAGIETSKAHSRNDTKSVFAEFRANLPGVERFDEHHACIPVGWWLKDQDVNHVIETVRNYATQIDSQVCRQPACGSVALA